MDRSYFLLCYRKREETENEPNPPILILEFSPTLFYSEPMALAILRSFEVFRHSSQEFSLRRTLTERRINQLFPEVTRRLIATWEDYEMLRAELIADNWAESIENMCEADNAVDALIFDNQATMNLGMMCDNELDEDGAILCDFSSRWRWLENYWWGSVFLFGRYVFFLAIILLAEFCFVSITAVWLMAEYIRKNLADYMFGRDASVLSIRNERRV